MPGARSRARRGAAPPLALRLPGGIRLFDLARRNALWLLLLIPGLMGWAWRGHRLRQRGWLLLGQARRLRGDGALGWIAAVACLVVALAQPRWGRVPAPPLPPGRDVVLVVD